MLVISQKVGDKVVLSSGITITVLDVKAGKVRSGIEAPKDVEIKRTGWTKKSNNNKSDK